MRGLHVRLGTTASCLHPLNPFNITMIIVMIACQINVSDDWFLLNSEKWPIFILHRELNNLIQHNRKKKSPYSFSRK